MMNERKQELTRENDRFFVQLKAQKDLSLTRKAVDGIPVIKLPEEQSK